MREMNLRCSRKEEQPIASEQRNQGLEYVFSVDIYKNRW